MTDHELIDRARRGDAQAWMRRALSGLPRAHRDCLLLAAAGDASYEQIGELLGMPVGTVKWRVSEARKRLRERLERLET